MYEYGDFVVYTPKNEIGRVAWQRGDRVFACYHSGCTAACTPIDLLREATPEEISHARPDLGYHRFDDHCPEYDEDCCYDCIHGRKNR